MMNQQAQLVSPQVYAEKCVVIHLGSYETKYGSADFDTPKSVPTCVAFPITPCSYEEYYSEQPKKEKKLKQTAREKQLIRLRGQLLADRGLISKDDVEKDIYFEQITANERPLVDDHISRHMHSPTRHRNLPMHNLLGANASFTYTPPILSNVLLGQEAIDACREQDRPGSHVTHELFFPIWRGRYNADKGDTASVTKVDDVLEGLFKHILNQLLDIPENEIERVGIVLIMPDQMIDQSSGVELRHVVDILLLRVNVAKVFVQRETVAATYGAGYSNVCIVDMGESKTSISVVDDGELVCQTDFICGGYHIVQTLLWTMYQSSLSVEGLSTDIHINDRDAIRSIFESQCHGEQKKEEVFRSVELTYARQSKLYKMQVGDPLYIAVLAYFNPKVLGKNKQQGPTGVVLNDIVDGEAEDYTLAEKEDFNSRSNLKNLSSAPIKYEAGEENGDPLQPETTKKKRAASAKKAVSATAGKTKSKTVPSLERVIIKMLKKSGMEFTKGKDKDSKKQKVNILLIGGCSMIKDFSELLKVRLEEYLTTKLKVTNCAINITSNDRDKGTNVKYLSWTGGCILNQLESAKEMWITNEEYKRHGHRVIYERAPL